MSLKALLDHLFDGGPGFCQVALTNACNARCQFCSFPSVPAPDRVMADPDRLAAGLAALHQGGVRYLSFTGGEPLLYPHLLDALTRTQALRMRTLLATNGALLSPHLIDELRRAGLHSLIISLDAASAEVHDRHRGLPGLTSHIREMLPLVKRAGLRPVASVTVSRLLDDLDDLVRFLDYLDFERLTFSYPITSLGSSYLGYAPHASVDFSPAELDDLFDRILALKDRAPLTILNSRLALRDLRNQLRRRAPRFPCLAGFKYFYVDWNLTVYRCHYLPETLGPLEDFTRLAPVREDCAACTIECYRDASVYQYPAVALAEAALAWRQGKVLKGLGALLHPYNFLALATLWEGLHWLRN